MIGGSASPAAVAETRSALPLGLTSETKGLLAANEDDMCVLVLLQIVQEADEQNR